MSDIQSWLAELGLEKYASVFADAEIEAADLTYLSEDNLQELGLPMGPRRRVFEAIRKLTDETGADTPTPQNQSISDSASDTVSKISPDPTSDAERRHLTVMFVDLVGSTEMATKMDAEDMRDVIRTTSAVLSVEIRALPGGRVLSDSRPSTPASANRSCQRQTVVFDFPAAAMIAWVPRPSTVSRMIRARQTCF